MEFAVLVKAVPELDDLRVDVSRRTLDRSAAALRLNPFDARALRVALERRRPGESVTVLSMGPPGAEPALREALACGADRAILLTDGALAGSDCLATARALARSLSVLRSEVVLTGARSTDSETGLVPPEVAALLRIPIAGPARALDRSDEGGFTVTADTRTGWVRVRVDPPCLVTTGEKVAKPLHPDAEKLAAA